MARISSQFGPPEANFGESAGGHMGLRGGLFFVPRGSKPAGNAAHRNPGGPGGNELIYASHSLLLFNWFKVQINDLTLIQGGKALEYSWILDCGMISICIGHLKY